LYVSPGVSLSYILVKLVEGNVSGSDPFNTTLYESTPPSGLSQDTSNFSVSNPTTGVTVRSCTLSGKVVP